MVYSRKSRIINKPVINGGAYNEFKMEQLQTEKVKNKNETIVNIPTTKDNTNEKLKRFVNFKFK